MEATNLVTKLEAIGDAIRSKTESTEKLTLDEMVTKIEGIVVGGVPEEALHITGGCSNCFTGENHNWLIKYFGDEIETEGITDASNMFQGNKIGSIPFDINLADGASCRNMFSMCSNLTKPPYIKGKIGEVQYLFMNCNNMMEIPEDWADNVDWSWIHDNSSKSMNYVFQNCYSLRRIPENLTKNIWNKSNSSYSPPYSSMINGCYVLEEVTLPVHRNSNPMTSNMFSSTFNYCGRLSRIVFDTLENGEPYQVQWSGQTIDLEAVGYSTNAKHPVSYSSGITVDTKIETDEDYASLKDNPDRWTTSSAYSLYGKASAIETINSLPDASAYLSEVGGSNVIKFKGSAGSKTDQGAINTMTESEIAVSTAKGFTVSFV